MPPSQEPLSLYTAEPLLPPWSLSISTQLGFYEPRGLCLYAHKPLCTLFPLPLSLCGSFSMLPSPTVTSVLPSPTVTSMLPCGLFVSMQLGLYAPPTRSLGIQPSLYGALEPISTQLGFYDPVACLYGAFSTLPPPPWPLCLTRLGLFAPLRPVSMQLGL